MELRQLRYYVAVAEDLHFGRAARRLHVAQPAVSEQVRKLEAELGVRLLDRSHRRVALTPAGEAMLEEGRRVLRQAAAAERAARRAGERAAARFRLGYMPDGVPHELARALQRFGATAPAIEVVVEGGPPLGIIEDVRADRLDAAVVCLPAPVTGLRTTVLRAETAVAAVPTAHRRGPVHLEHMAHTTLVLLDRERNPAFYDAVMAGARSAAVAPAAIETSAGVDCALLAVAAGRGVALLPASAAVGRGLPGVRLEPLATPLPPCPLVVATRAHDATTTTAAFLRAVRATTRGGAHAPAGAVGMVQAG
jgi:DNA-binding transcriptional LysR family regulator